MTIKPLREDFNPYPLLLALLALLTGIEGGLLTFMLVNQATDLLIIFAICLLFSFLVLGLLYRLRINDSVIFHLPRRKRVSSGQGIQQAGNSIYGVHEAKACPKERGIGWLEWGLLLLVFLVYTRFSDVLIHSHGLPSITQPLVILLLLAIFLQKQWRRSKKKGIHPKWLAPTILLVTYGIVRSLSLFYAAEFEPAQEALSDYLKDSIIAVIIVILLQTGATLRRVIWALLAAGIFLGTISVIQYLTGAFHYSFLGFGKAQVQHIIGQTEDFRIGGPLGEPNFYAQILLPLIALAFERMWNERALFKRFLAGWALVACTLAVVFTFSRGALVGLLAMGGITVLLRRPSPQELFGGLLIMVLLLPMVPGRYLDRAITLIDVLPGANSDPRSEVSFRGRTSELIVGWQMFVDHPLLGVGLNNYPVHYQDYSRRVGLETRREARAPHSLYLEVMSELGILGIAAFSALLGSLFMGIYRTRKRLWRLGLREYSRLSTAIGIGLIGYLTAGIFLHAAYPRFLWVLVGIGLAIPQLARNEAARTDQANRQRPRFQPQPTVKGF